MAINYVCLEGYLFKDLKDVEMNKTKSGEDMLSFAFILSNNSTEDRRVFVNCLAFKGTATYLQKYGKKGDKIFVGGQITSKTDANGKQTSLSIIVNNTTIISKDKVTNDDNANEQVDTTPNPTQEVSEEDLPF